MENFKSWHPNYPVSLSTCQDEPIHIPGAIQTFGVLIAFDETTGLIRGFSENALTLIPELKDFEAKGYKLSDFFEIKDSSTLATTPKKGRRLIEALVKNQSYFGVRYSSNGLEILELDLDSKSEHVDENAIYLTNLPLMMQEVQEQDSIKNLSAFIAKKFKQITGFDRVMVYQYDDEWNGEVVAEEKEARLEPFLGLHYPASDIPAQARALYEKNWIRIIPTVDYKPSPLVPAALQSLDLSNSVVRSVSPIHIRYLKNMGVGASMSISLIVDGQLWGLVACHHYSGAHHVPLNVRIGCEAYGQLISWHIKTLAAAEALSSQIQGEVALQKVLSVFGGKDSFQSAAKNSEAELLKLFGANGIVIRLGDESVKLGHDPGEVFCSAVAKALVGRTVLDPLVTKEVTQFPALRDLPFNEKASGLMALALSPNHNYYILCTRPEERFSVNWAGDPNTKSKVDVNNPDQRLDPRGSFALWAQMHEGQSCSWSAHSIDLLKKFGLLFFKIVIERKEIIERSNNELKELNRAKDEFVATVSHELRTPLNAIIGWTDLALSGELEEQKFPEALRIIQRNARSQNQLVSDLLDVSRIISGKMRLSVRNMRVTEVVEAVLLSFTPAADAKKIQFISHLDDSADSIIGDPNRVQQVVWNLLSNAIKFSPKGSRIWINVRRRSSQMEVSVQDEGVGLDEKDFDKIFGRFEQVDSSVSRRAGGLGLGLAISKHIVELHGGKLEVESRGPGKGSLFRALFPIAPVQPKKNEPDLPIDDRFKGAEKVPEEQKALKGEVILIVEDDPDASRFLRLLLQAYGAKTHFAFNGLEAMEVLREYKSEIGIVLSDIGMPQMDGYQLITEIRASKDPQISSLCAVALTAFGRPQDRITALKAGFDSYIAKPVMQEELITVLETVCKSRQRSS